MVNASRFLLDFFIPLNIVIKLSPWIVILENGVLEGRNVSGGQRNNLMRSVTREVDGTTDKSQMLLEPTVERVSCFRSPTRRRGRGAETFIWHVV